jgi:hypothetical protein
MKQLNHILGRKIPNKHGLTSVNPPLWIFVYRRTHLPSLENVVTSVKNTCSR